MLDRIDYKTCKPGDRIPVMVGGKLYETIITDAGVQRFIENTEHPLVKRLRDRSDGTHNPNGDIKDLNEMAHRYHSGEFDKRDYAEMNMALGYSVSGFCDLSSFQDWDIDNPLWGELDQPDPSTAVEITVSISSAARAVLKTYFDDYSDELNQAGYGTQGARDEARAILKKLAGDDES